MKLVNVDDVPWFGQVGHREEGADFKRMIQGEDMSPNNFEFSIVQVDSYYHTPRHRHNFDQVRYILSGSFAFDRGMEQPGGTIGYFSEGTYYEQMAEGRSQTLLLQAANNINSDPYISFDTLREIVKGLKEKEQGEFHDGVYTTYRNGKKVNKEGYEAIWEYATGSKLSYPKPRYQQPVIMDPANFKFVPLSGNPAVRIKPMSTFSERELSIGFYKMEKGGCLQIDGVKDGRQLFYVLNGEGRVNSAGWREGTAIYVTHEEQAEFQADASAEIYYLRLPTYIPDHSK